MRLWAGPFGHQPQSIQFGLSSKLSLSEMVFSAPLFWREKHNSAFIINIRAISVLESRFLARAMSFSKKYC
jgi:hypothetical protein